MILELSYRDRNTLSFAERFSIPRCYPLSKTETLLILYVAFWRAMGPNKFNSTWCTESYQGIPFTVSVAEDSCYFFVWEIQSKYCKVYSKTRQSTDCWLKNSHSLYFKGIFPLSFPFKIGGEVAGVGEAKRWIEKEDRHFHDFRCSRSANLATL